MKVNKYHLLFLLSFLPIVILCLLVWRYGYRFPYWDEILYLPLFDKLNQGTLQFLDLFVQQNDHRPFLPRVVTLCLAKLTSWNELAILFFSVFLTCLTFFIFFYVAVFHDKSNSYKNLNQNETNVLPLSLEQILSINLISIFIFSWTQMENWVWGLQLMMFLTNFLVVLLLFAMTIFELSIFTLMVYILLAIFASFSFANGLLIWFASLPLLLYKLFKHKKRDYLLLLIWVLSAIGVFIFYFINFKKPGITNLGNEPNLVNRFLYFILFIGSPLSGFISTPPWHGVDVPKINFASYLFGVAGLLLYVYLLQKIKKRIIVKKTACLFENNMQKLIVQHQLKPDIEEFFFWKSIALFTLLSGVLLAFGRSSLGSGQALSSRYITTNMLFWCSLIGMFNFYIKQSDKKISQYLSKHSKQSIFIIFIIIFALLCVAPIYTNQKWHNIARWKNMGWYALCSGYNGRLYWTDLWGDEKDFIQPKVLQTKIFPIIKKYELCGIHKFENPAYKKDLAILFVKEAEIFIKQKMWKPAVCYLDTAEYLNPSLPEIEPLKKQIPAEIFPLYQKYQAGMN